jgi:tetratricopeptide (TPR) repeat protein
MELGTLRGRQGRHAEALELYEVARRGYEDHGSDEDRCRLDLNLAPTLAELAGVDAALAVLDHATALADAGGHELLGAHLRYTRGNLAMTSGAYEGALGCFEQARARYEALGEVGEVADCDSVLGVLLCEMQPPAAAEAERLQRRALAVYEEHGTLIDRLVCRTHLGHTLLHAGRLDAAAAELRQVVAEARARGLGDVLDDALTMLAEVDPDEAAVVRAELRRGR